MESIGWGFPLVEIGVMCPLLPRVGIIRLLIGIARSHHSGINEIIDGVRRHHQFCISELHRDHIRRKDIGHIHLKHIGPMLLQKGGAFTCLFCILVLTARIFALSNLGSDGPFSNRHLHPIYGCPCGSRKDVYGLKRSSPFIFVYLGHQHISHDTGDIHVHGSGFQGKPVHFRVITLYIKIGG